MKLQTRHYLLGILRILLGWVFFWPFLDKLLGLGFSTQPGKGWIDGSSPTYGFLTFSSKGPFQALFQSLAGVAVVDWLFMLGCLAIGLALIAGAGVRIAAYSGSVLLLLMWFAVLPPTQNPFLDDHIVYAIVLNILALVNAGDFIGLGRWWSNTSLVKKFPILR